MGDVRMGRRGIGTGRCRLGVPAEGWNLSARAPATAPLVGAAGGQPGLPWCRGRRSRSSSSAFRARPAGRCGGNERWPWWRASRVQPASSATTCESSHSRRRPALSLQATAFHHTFLVQDSGFHQVMSGTRPAQAERASSGGSETQVAAQGWEQPSRDQRRSVVAAGQRETTNPVWGGGWPSEERG